MRTYKVMQSLKIVLRTIKEMRGGASEDSERS